MKKLGFAFFLLWVIVSAQSYGQEVFTASSRWNGHNVMTVLEVQGIMMDATEKALDKCRSRGNRLCAFKNSSIVTHGVRLWSSSYGRYRRYTKVEVVLQAIDRLPIVENRAYTESDTWTLGEGQERLGPLGVQGEALSAAISVCEEDGNHFCVIERVINLERGWRYKATAEARVRGYSLFQGRY